MTMTFIKRIIP